jgi:hypothetical protein
MPIITIKNDTYRRMIFYWIFRASHGLATFDCFYFLFGTGKKFLIEFYLHFRFLPNILSLSIFISFCRRCPIGHWDQIESSEWANKWQRVASSLQMEPFFSWSSYLFPFPLSFFNSPFPVCPFLFLFLLF